MVFIYFKIAVGMALGILLWEYVNIIPVTILLTSLIIIGDILTKKFTFIKPSHILVCISLITGCFLSFYTQSYEMNGLHPTDGKYIELTGYVYDIPTKSKDRYSYVIKAESVKYLDREYKTDELVRMTSEEKFEYGEGLIVNGFQERFDARKNRSDFDYGRYYKSKGIYYSINDHIIKSNGMKNLSGINHLVKTVRINASRFIHSHFTGDSAALLNAIITGSKNEFSENFKDVLLKTNTQRMLYPAYLHIFLIISLIGTFAVFVKREVRDYIFLAILILYAIFNFDRMIHIKSAFLMMVTVISLRKLGYTHFPDLLSIVITVMLILNPLLIYNAGFVISITAGWLIFILKDPLFEIFGFISHTGLKRFIVFSLILTLGLMPVLAYFFYGASIYSTLLNYIFFPFVIVIISAFPLFCVEKLILPREFIAEYLLDGALWCLNKLPYLVEKLPLCTINLKRPGIMEIVVFYLCLLLIRYIFYRGFQDYRTKITITLIICSVLSTGAYQFNMRGSMYLNFVNVGQGDGACIQLPKGEKIIIDGGGGAEYSDYNVGKNIFVPFLKCEGFNKIDLALVTHYHKDHCEGIIEALKTLNIKKIAMPGCSPDNKYRTEIERLARENGTEIQYISKSDKILFEKSGALLKILSPDFISDTADENNSSVVCQLEYKDFKALYTGDITKEMEHQLLDTFSDINLLKVAHHGSANSTSQEFIDTVKPELAIISVGEENSYGHPNKEITDRLINAGTKIFRTDKNGDISVLVNRDGKILVNTLYEANYS